MNIESFIPFVLATILILIIPGPTIILGGCPRIEISSQVKACWKNKHSHILNIASIIFPT